MEQLAAELGREELAHAAQAVSVAPPWASSRACAVRVLVRSGAL